VFRIQLRAIRIVLRWQLIATAALTLASAIPWGVGGAFSAGLGGLTNVAAGWAYGWVLTRSRKRDVGETLRAMFRAEAAKVLVILAGLWSAFTYYPAMIHAAFLGTFVVTVVMFAAAIAVREDNNEATRPSGTRQHG
jgi:F0F1-type ATP synthase assembly protein I